MRKMTLPKLNVDFDTDAECRTALEQLRWTEGVKCLRCGSDKISRITTRKQFDCDACRYRFSVTTGTIFHDSHLPLPKWFLAVLLICEAKKGISSCQLHRTLGVAKKTAWYLNHRIREAMKDASTQPLSGTVEVDETYIGGKMRGKENRWKNKQMVVAALMRGGDIRISTGRTNDRATLHGFVKTHAPNPERICTDEWPAYRGLSDTDTRHDTVQHSA